MKYDFFIALENRFRETKPAEIRFPKSAILYLRNTGHTPNNESVKIIFPDGQNIYYDVPVIKVQKYDKEEIFRKKLFIFLPYYIMRYEKKLPGIGKDEAKIREFLKEYQEIMDHLSNESSPEVYSYMLDFISKVAEHVRRKESRLKERMGDFMGGQVIRTRTDDIIEQGIKQGIKQGMKQGLMEEKKDTAVRMASLGILIPVIALAVDLPEETVEKILARK